MDFGNTSKIFVREGCFFSNNNATFGGAIHIATNTTLNIIGSGSPTSTKAVIFQENSAERYGGAILIESFSSLTTNYVSFSTTERVSFDTFISISLLTISTYKKAISCYATLILLIKDCNTST